MLLQDLMLPTAEEHVLETQIKVLDHCVADLDQLEKQLRDQGVENAIPGIRYLVTSAQDASRQLLTQQLQRGLVAGRPFLGFGLMVSLVLTMLWSAAPWKVFGVALFMLDVTLAVFFLQALSARSPRNTPIPQPET